MAREAQFNGDDRFRLTEQFVEEDDEMEVNATGADANDTEAGKTSQERSAEYEIMNRVLGKPHTAAPPSNKGQGSL